MERRTGRIPSCEAGGGVLAALGGIWCRRARRCLARPRKWDDGSGPLFVLHSARDGCITGPRDRGEPANRGGKEGRRTGGDG